MRTVPVMRAIFGELERWSPAATLVNDTNPTQIVAEAVTRYTRVRCLAICDQTDDDRAHLAAALGLPPAAVELESVGLNHATWSTHCRIEGGDGVERLIAACDDVLASDGVSPRVKPTFRWRSPAPSVAYRTATCSTTTSARPPWPRPRLHRARGRR